MVRTLVIVHDLVYVTISKRVREWQRVLINGTLNLAMIWIRRVLDRTAITVWLQL